jgi:protein SCO1
MIFYFQYEKKRLERKRIVEMSKGYGKPKVGGPFELKDVHGNVFTEKDLLGKYSLVSLAERRVAVQSGRLAGTVQAC